MSPVPLRAAVDQHDDGIFARRVKAVGLDEEAVNVRAIGRIHPEFLERRELVRVQHGVVQMGESQGSAAGGCGAVDLDRRFSGLMRVDHGLAVAREDHVVQFAIAGRGHMHRATLGRNPLDGLPPAVSGGEEQAARIGRPDEAVHPPVDVVGQVGDLPGGAFEHHQLPAVALVTGARLSPPGEIPAVGRIARCGIGARTAGDLHRLLRLGAATHGQHEQVGIGADGGHRIEIHGVAKLRAVGRNIVIVGAPERKRRHLAVPRRQIAHRSAACGHHQQMAAAPRGPGGPVPVEQLRVNARFHRIGAVDVEALLVAGVVGAAFRVDGARENQVLPIRREDFAVGFGRQAGDLPGVAAVRIHQPDLGRAAAVGDIRDCFAVGRPARARVVIAAVRDLARRAALERHRPDLLRFPIGGQIDGLHGERHRFPVGRNLRIADPLQLEQSVRIEGPLLCE